MKLNGREIAKAILAQKSEEIPSIDEQEEDPEVAVNSLLQSLKTKDPNKAKEYLTQAMRKISEVSQS